MFLFLPPFFPSHSFFLTCSLCTFRDSRRSTIASWRLVKDRLALCVSFAFLSASLIKRKEKGRERKWWTREEDSGIRIVSSGDKRYFFWGGSRWNKLFPSLCCFFREHSQKVNKKHRGMGDTFLIGIVALLFQALPKYLTAFVLQLCSSLENRVKETNLPPDDNGVSFDIFTSLIRETWRSRKKRRNVISCPRDFYTPFNFRESASVTYVLCHVTVTLEYSMWIITRSNEPIIYIVPRINYLSHAGRNVTKD